MEYVNLGKTDIKVAKVCLGCMGFGDPQTGMHSWTLSYEESKKIIKTCPLTKELTSLILLWAIKVEHQKNI